MSAPMKRAVVYARVSTDKQDARSIEDQARRCREHADRNPLKLVRVFEDTAISGSHTHRPGLQEMLGAARAGDFEVVLVDDLSRLSRNDVDFNTLVFRQLPALGVNVIDVATGGSSDDERSRTHFKFTALFNEMQLDQVRRQTHRGLEGRALAGLATGGRTYGYDTEPEPNPPDPRRVRKVYVVNKAEALVLVRIFEMYGLKLMGLRAIASTLNVEGVAAPGDNRRGHKLHGKGWGSSTVRALLCNRRYLGELSWNVRKHLRTDEAKSRVAKRNPPEKIITVKKPCLAIISQELWDAVETRFSMNTSRGAGRGRPIGSGRKAWHLLGGVMRCAECGFLFGMTGSRWKNGKRYATMGCQRARVRGPESCGNTLMVSEKKVNAALVAALRETLLDPVLMTLVHEGYREQLNETKRRPGDSEVAQVETELREAEGALRNITAAFAKEAWSEDLSNALKTASTRRSALRERLAGLSKRNDPVKTGEAAPAAVEALIDRLFETIKTDHKAANDILRKHLGSVIMTPEKTNPRRGYVATGAFSFGVAEKGCCGGRI